MRVRFVLLALAGLLAHPGLAASSSCDPFRDLVPVRTAVAAGPLAEVEATLPAPSSKVGVLLDVASPAGDLVVREWSGTRPDGAHAQGSETGLAGGTFCFLLGAWDTLEVRVQGVAAERLQLELWSR